MEEEVKNLYINNQQANSNQDANKQPTTINNNQIPTSIINPKTDLFKDSNYILEKKKSPILKIMIILVIVIIFLVIGILLYSYLNEKKNYGIGNNNSSVITSQVDTKLANKVPNDAKIIKYNGKDVYCFNTDNGNDYFIRGTLTLYDMSGNEIKDNKNFVDKCNGNTLTEFNCESDKIETTYICPGLCVDSYCQPIGETPPIDDIIITV